jgi:hypothetical protein
MRLTNIQRFVALGIGSVAAAALGFAYLDDTSWVPTDHPAIRYFEAPIDDPIAQLEEKLQRKQVKLEYDQKGWGYLPSVLRELGINPDSQILVFSKTSFQASRISTETPRALYFNDEVAVGDVQNGEVLEFVALDSKQAMNFYTLDIHKSDNPGFARRDVCLQCHQSPATQGVPGIFISSVYPSPSGMPAFRAGATATDHRSAFDTRWGGWYVTGTHGSQNHMGNAVAPDPQRPQVLDLKGTQNVTSLEKRFDTKPYLAKTSDIVALMTYEHQTRMTNLMNRIGWETRIAEHDGKLNGETQEHINSEIEDLVTYMLFADEAPIREPVQGVSTFSKTFPERGPRDSKGRSFRDFDLQKRLFKYPLSYMIYTRTFDALPAYAHGRILQRLYDVLSGRDTSKKFARLSAEDRQNVLEILLDTKPNLPSYFRGSAANVTAQARQ